LTGNWRDEHLFVLGQALAMYDDIARHLAECDAKLQALLAQLGQAKVDLGKAPRAGSKLRAEFDVTHAFLLPHEGHHIDVTNRVKKYAGQNGDFNAHAGSFLFVSDMFPYHDVDDYARLMLLDEHSEKTLVYSMHDIVNTSVVI
jgi:hypothetical protein